MQPEKNHRDTIKPKTQARKKENETDISEYGPVILTGGHGGAVPALIVKVVRKIFKIK